MSRKPYLAVLQFSPLDYESTKNFDSESEFKSWFDSKKNVRWGNLIRRSNGEIIIKLSRPDDLIIADHEAVYCLDD